MMPRDLGVGTVKVQDEVIYVIIDDVEEPVVVPMSRYPELKDGDRVIATYTSVDTLRLRKV